MTHRPTGGINDTEASLLSIAISLKRIADTYCAPGRHNAAPHPGRISPTERKLLMDIFDRIAAAITAKQGGDTAALEQHVSAIDAHLSQLDTEDTDEKTRLSNIEAGLGKVADAVNPTPAPTPATTA